MTQMFVNLFNLFLYNNYMSCNSLHSFNSVIASWLCKYNFSSYRVKRFYCFWLLPCDSLTLLEHYQLTQTEVLHNRFIWIKATYLSRKLSEIFSDNFYPNCTSRYKNNTCFTKNDNHLLWYIKSSNKKDLCTLPIEWINVFDSWNDSNTFLT
jgi:hypothetical protein